ncbi:MAG: FtsX-like permease family protein, partial [Bacteroidetes bacterium]
SSTALAGPKRLVLTEAMAERLYGPDWQHDPDLLGSVLRIGQEDDYLVQGVCANPPAQSSLDFAFLMPVEDLLERWPYQRNWNNFNFTMFLRLNPAAKAAQTEQTLNDRYQAQIDNPGAYFKMQPMEDMHLYGTFENGQVVGGRITYVRIFALSALFLLLIACINYMNLATARASQRAREVGIRKVVGATRLSLRQQFFGEALVMTLGALLLALVVTDSLLPAFNQLTDKALRLPFHLPTFWAGLGSVLLLTTFLSGLYPAVMLSSFQVIDILKGSSQGSSRGSLWLRRGLVVFQFGLSIVLICGTLLVYQQMRYIQDKELGLEREQVVQFEIPQYTPARYQQLRQQLAQVAGIKGITATDQSPIEMTNSTSNVHWSGRPEDLTIIFHGLKVQYGFTQTLGIEIAKGRDFSPAYGTDSMAFLVNETAVRAMALKEPILGQELSMWGHKGPIVGVMKDFHTASLHEPIEPVVAIMESDNSRLVHMRLEAGQAREALAAAQAAFETIAPGFPFRYEFLNDQFARMYESERVMRTLAGWAAGVGIFIACLGLLGLATFMAERRRREMSIRKVLGASVPQLMLLLTREFSLLVLVAFGLAAPVAYLLLDDWLSGFAYRVGLSPWLFVGAGLLTLLIAWATVAGQALRAASADPADTLRTE